MNKTLQIFSFKVLLLCTVIALPITIKAQPVVENYAMSLPGGTNGAVSNIDLSGLNLNSLPFTIEFWMKPEGTQPAYAGLFYHRGTSNAGVQFAAGWQGANMVRLDYQNPASTNGLVSPAITTDVWHHVAVVITSTGRILYIDGTQYTETLGLTNYDFSTGNLYLGWDKAIANRVFKGLMDEVRVWSIARTSQELEDNKYKTLTGSEAGLAGYWNFNDSAATVTDLTANGKNGTINGGVYVLSNLFDPMVVTGSGMSQKSKEVNTPSQTNEVARLEITTANRLNPLSLNVLYLSANGTSSLADISNVNIYYTGSDSTFNSNIKVASLGVSPAVADFTINCNQSLNVGSNYFWIAYDVAKNATNGHALDVACDSFVLAGADTITYFPSNASPAGELTINSNIFMPNVKLPVDEITGFGQTPTGGANFVSFQQNAITTYKGYQYVTYWNNAYRVCVARKKLPLGNWEIVEFPDHTVTATRIADNHYSISMGICPNDGTIHVAFDHHGDVFHYKKSIVDLANKPDELSWSAASFGAKQDYLIPGQQMTQVTYPRFIAKPDGNMIYEYRYGTSGAGDSYIYEYSAASGTWSQTGKYIDGLTLNNNGYLNGIHYDPAGRLHASWVWRETPDPLTNHDVSYMYSDNNGQTWMSHAGVQVGTVNTNPVKSNTTGIIIWTVTQNRGLINQESQAVDSKGGVHILQSYLKDTEPNSTNFWNGRNKAYLRHIYKDENGTWQNDVIDAISANRSEIAVDEGDNMYVVAPNYRVYYASAVEKWKKWTVFDISESSSAINEGLIDRESLLNESVLSFVFAQTGGKIIVPRYLIDKSKPGKGNGLNVSVHSGADFGTHFYQNLDSVNLTTGSIPYSIDSVSVRCLGTLETRYAEAYTLQFTTTGESKIWINNVLVLNTGVISGETTYPIVLGLQPSHKYDIKIEGKYATPNVITKLEWESERQTRELVPLSALSGTLVQTPDKIKSATENFQIVCQPNPFTDNTIVRVNGQFSYQLYNACGNFITQGKAANQFTVGDGLPNGVYMLKIVQGSKSRTIKLVKI